MGDVTTMPERGRFRSEFCQKGQHEQCSRSSLIGLCDCWCHDEMNDLEADLRAA